MYRVNAFPVRPGRNAIRLSRSYKVLLVDSNDTCLAILSKMLRNLGYLVITAKWASDAFSIVMERAHELDLILAETNLLDMDNFELLETLRFMTELPVVLMFSEFNKYEMTEGLLRGAEFCLEKPINREILENLWQYSLVKRTSLMVASEGEAESGLTSDNADENQVHLDIPDQNDNLDAYDESSSEAKLRRFRAKGVEMNESLNQ